VEAERERDRVREGALAWRGIGAVAARPWCAQAARCRATVESGGVGVTRVDVVNRWPGRDGGPVVSVWVRCEAVR
jgi:hypothetical protein